MGLFDFRKKQEVPKSEGVGSAYIEDEKATEGYEPVKPVVAAPTSDQISDMQRPDVPFMQAFQFIQTLPKLQNTVLSEIDNVISRDWYFAPVEGDDKENAAATKTDPNAKITEAFTQDKNPAAKVGNAITPKKPAPKCDPQEAVEFLNKWEVDFELERLLEYLITDWSATGNCLIGISDWQPVQLSRIEGMEREAKTGKPQKYWFIKYNGERLALDATKFIHARYWDMDRLPWSKSKFHSLFTVEYTDVDVKKPKPLAAIWRTMLQDVGKIHHKFAMPRVIYGFKDVSKEVMESDIAPTFNKIKEGGRAAFSKEFTMSQETVDGTARFTDSIDLINNEVDSGTGSSVNRIQTKASALADAREAGAGTDDRYLGDMDRIRRLMNNEIIPRVIAQQKNDLANFKEYRGIIEWRWGAKDSFDYNPQELKMWKDAGVMGVKEIREMLKNSGKPLNDEWFESEAADRKKEEDEKFQKVVDVKNAGQKAPEPKGKEAHFLEVQPKPEPLVYNIKLDSSEIKAELSEAMKKLEEWYAKAKEFNPYHDEAGRFTDASGATGETSVAAPSKQTGVQQANRKDIKQRAAAVKKLLDNAHASGKGGKYQHSLFAENDKGQITNQKRVAVENGLMVMNPKQLESTRLFVSEGTDAEISNKMKGTREAAGWHMTYNNDANLNEFNKRNDSDFKAGDIGIALGASKETTRNMRSSVSGEIIGTASTRTGGLDPYQVYSVTVHEAHHHIESEMRHNGTPEEKAAIARWDSAVKEVYSGEKRYNELVKNNPSIEYSDIRHRNVDAMKVVHGSYAMKEQSEVITTMAQSYYAQPNYGFSADPARFMKVEDRLANNEFGELYLERAETRYPQLKELHDAFRNIQRVNGNIT